MLHHKILSDNLELHCKIMYDNVVLHHKILYDNLVLHYKLLYGSLAPRFEIQYALGLHHCVGATPLRWGYTLNYCMAQQVYVLHNTLSADTMIVLDFLYLIHHEISPTVVIHYAIITVWYSNSPP